MIYAYCRVSTSHQHEKNQHFVISQYAKKHNFKIQSWVEETISTSKPLAKRQLNTLLNRLKEGDILITTEISRLGRNLLEIMHILQLCLEKNCQIWTLKENYRLGADIQSKVLAFAFGLTAELSKALLKERVRESLARGKAEGKKLGRPLSVQSQKLKQTENIHKIHMLQSQGVNKAQIAALLHVHPTTLYRFLNREQQENL